MEIVWVSSFLEGGDINVSISWEDATVPSKAINQLTLSLCKYYRESIEVKRLTELKRQDTVILFYLPH